MNVGHRLPPPGIHMEGVHAGWLGGEDPPAMADEKRGEHRFNAPPGLWRLGLMVASPVFGSNTGERVCGGRPFGPPPTHDLRIVRVVHPDRWA